MRKTPYIQEQTQGFSAIVKELVFDTPGDTQTVWVPEESITDYITYTPQIIARQNGVTVTPEETAAKSARVEVAADPSRITYKYRVTENGHYYIPDIITGKGGARKVEVDVHIDDLMEDGVAYKNGVYEPVSGYGFKTFRTEVKAELPPNPSPEDVYTEDLYVTENGRIQIPSGYTGVKTIKAQVPKDISCGWTDETQQAMLAVDSSAAIVDDDNTIHIFSENRHITITQEGVISDTGMPFNTMGLSAFIVDGNIHLVGVIYRQSMQPFHRVQSGTSWVDADKEVLPMYMISPRIVMVEGVPYIVGAGNGTQDEPATHMYRYVNDVWEEVSILTQPVYNYMDAVYMNGRIHVWYEEGLHVSYDPETGIAQFEENGYHGFFKSSHYKLLPVSDGVMMINAENSSTQSGSSIAYCKRTQDGRYKYKNLGWLPYKRFNSENNPCGFGQNAFMVGEDIHIIGYEGGTSNEHYRGNMAFFI